MVRKTAKTITPSASVCPPFVLVLIRLSLILSSYLVLLKVEQQAGATIRLFALNSFILRFMHNVNLMVLSPLAHPRPAHQV